MYTKLFKLYEIICVLLLLCAAGLGTLAFMSRITPDFPIRLLSVVSGSMEPSIPLRSGVIVARQNDYFSGDVVTYTLGAHLITHRVFYSGQYLVTKGDANRLVDPQTVDKSQVIGKVIVVIPYFGYIQESVKSIYGLILFVVFPSVLIIVKEIWVIVQEIRKIMHNSKMQTFIV